MQQLSVIWLKFHIKRVHSYIELMENKDYLITIIFSIIMDYKLIHLHPARN